MSIKEIEKRFTFPSLAALDEFLENVSVLETREKHHATKEVTRESHEPTVVLRSHTHSALRPPLDPSETAQDRAHPGITLRDIRFAYGVEGLLSSSG
ncbi:hypothetical protein C8Q76DRAFT_798960 [Earliella scabrosa]|nr:hypothetical protein C8Q76DRAFT_798960 [Earliella scabrosa]